jgi:hypothetical protein
MVLGSLLWSTVSKLIILVFPMLKMSIFVGG